MARARSMGRAAGATLLFALLLAASVRAQSKPTDLDGVWRTEGYGLIGEVRGDTLQLYQVTAVSCLPGQRYFRTQASAGVQAAFAGEAGAPPELLVLGGRTPSERVFHGEGSASSLTAARIPALPDRCARPTAGDAAGTFDVFWHTYAENYPFFALRGVDWKAVGERYRPLATPGVPGDSLMAILRAMVEPLHDAHTFISDAQRRRGFRGGRPDPDPLDAATRAALGDSIVSRYVRGGVRSWCNGRVAFGWLADSLGYLRVSGFAGYAPGGFQPQQDALEAALDTIFAAARGMRGLVIDVRFNGGGSDVFGLQLASRLATAPYTAYAKVARADPADPSRYTTPQPSIVRPSQRPGYRGPVVELTSRYSVSAAETFTQALMGRRPVVERVGENTQGVFSDVLVRKLPNGWVFGLPNELFLTAAGTSFDVTGIPPTVPVPLFPPGDRAAGRDAGLERAVALLHGR